MPDNSKGPLFGEHDDVDPSQVGRREGERAPSTRHALPQAKVASRKDRRRREEALREAERRREAGEDNIDYNPNKRRGIIPLTIALILVLVGGAFAWNTLGLSLPSFQSSGGDYEGSGINEYAEVTVHQGDAGGMVGSNLVAAGITKSTSAFVEVLAANPKANLQPGTYRLKKQQSAQSALDALLDPKNRTSGSVTIPEGLWQSEIFDRLSTATKHPVSEYQAVKAKDLGLPDTMNGKLEGWLFPSTYNFDQKTSAKQQLQTMVKMTRDQMSQLNVPADQYQRILTIASIVQAESPAGADDGKVARVVMNRLKPGNRETHGKLQMDSSVHYVIHKRGTVTTTDDQRKNPSPYNTYQHAGLPPTPYNSPGLPAIKAAVNPTPGDWMYFVTVNLNTGETLFAKTYAEHEQNLKKFQQWCHDNPGKGC